MLHTVSECRNEVTATNNKLSWRIPLYVYIFYIVPFHFIHVLPFHYISNHIRIISVIQTDIMDYHTYIYNYIFYTVLFQFINWNLSRNVYEWHAFILKSTFLLSSDHIFVNYQLNEYSFTIWFFYIYDNTFLSIFTKYY